MPLLGQQSHTRRTWAAPAGWSGGTYGKGTPADTTVFGTWRPASIAVVQLLKDGDRVRDPHTFYTKTALRTTNQHTGGTADYISPDGGATFYEVTDYGIHDASLPASPIAHRKYVCLLVQEADG